MARKNIKLTVLPPSVYSISPKLEFVDVANADTIKIPFRYPFVDVVNLADLKTKGWIRSKSQNVSTEYGGSNATNTGSNLGLRLPRTEKLILLAKVKTATTAVAITIKANSRTGQSDMVVNVPSGAVGDLYMIDLYDLGFYVGDDGEITLSVDKDISLCLIARF